MTTVHETSKPTHRLYAVGVPACLALLGLLVLVGGLRLGVGSASAPGAGMWPAVIGVIWVTSALTVTISAVRGAPLPPLRPSLKPATGVAVTVLFVLLFSYVGFATSIAITTLLWMRLFGDLTWRQTIAATVAITGLMYVLFVLVINTPVPDSLLHLP